MRKLSIILLILMLVGCGSTYKNTGSGPADPHLSYGEALALSDTPQKVANWMAYAITYKADTLPKDINKSPDQTVKDGCGDCEDYAILAKYMLGRHGYSAEVIFTFPGDGRAGHALCVIKHAEGEYSYISNSQYVAKRFACYADIAGRFFYPGRWYIWI